MNKLLVTSITAIVLTMVAGFSILFFVMDTDKSSVTAESEIEPISNQTEESKEQETLHPYPAPSMDEVPAGEEGELIKLGQTYHNETATALDEYVGNTLSCASCHADGGTGEALDLIGIPQTYPQYNPRAGKEVSLEDRINGCFRRSMNGKPLPKEGEEMKAMVAYYTFISKNVPNDIEARPWAKLKKVEGDITNLNIEEGEELYKKSCIACHGEDGSGGSTGIALWGDNSYNIGAGMARVRTAAGFIQAFMPAAPMGGYDKGTFTDEEALNIAAYINSMERPDFPDKINDWPNGDAPDDAAYETLAGKKDTNQ